LQKEMIQKASARDVQQVFEGRNTFGSEIKEELEKTRQAYKQI